MARHFWASLRVEQWVKNAFVLLPLMFSRHLFEGAAALKAGGLFALFCVLSSAVYLFNDVLDREKDRLHPDKRQRPVAAGNLSAGAAVAGAAALSVLALSCALFLSPAAAGFLAGYAGLNLFYTLSLKRVAVLDVMAIALGFVLRVSAGAAVIGVPASPWLIVCTFLLSSFLGFCKRKQELAVLGPTPSGHRAALADYSLPYLDQLISASAAATVITYALYTLADETVEKFGTQGLLFSVPFVVYGVFRYIYQVNVRGDTRSPSQIILTDKSLMAGLVLWLFVCAGVIYWAG
jgi:4-hydroxybenzoate polyprenyltransferase